MTFLPIFLSVAPLSLIFFAGVYAIAKCWIAEDSEIRRQMIRRIIQAKTCNPLQDDDRPYILDEPTLPWKHRNWKGNA